MDLINFSKRSVHLLPSRFNDGYLRTAHVDSLEPPGLYSPWNFLGQNTRVCSLSLISGDLSNPVIEPRSSTLQADSLSAEPQGNLKNTGVGCLSLLQQIFLTQELNWSPLNCRQILLPTELSGKPKESTCPFKQKFTVDRDLSCSWLNSA